MSTERRQSLYRLGEQLIEKRTTVLLVVALLTLIFAGFALRLNMVTRFDELLPQNHPFIKVHNKYASTFGGANTISLMLEVKEGTIFTKETLTKIYEITQRLDKVYGVNHELINSLAHRTNRRVRMLSGGMQVVEPVMAHAPDSKYLCFHNENRSLWIVEVATGIASLMMGYNFYTWRKN